MKLKIIEDSIKKANIFIWFGKIDQANLKSWLSQKDLNIPEDLFEFLCETGGGGLPKKYLIFHSGALGISVIEKNSLNYFVLDKSYSKIKSFYDLNDWYCNYIRKEFADRYGLDENNEGINIE